MACDKLAKLNASNQEGNKIDIRKYISFMQNKYEIIN